ncbi:hypothetical protein LXA43DRAFT_1104830 [Ganoderma leucocontextum]|nr:hypothetical protein LXA43DRAFT_1104830 [Ganoderma leucocontextum]
MVLDLINSRPHSPISSSSSSRSSSRSSSSLVVTLPPAARRRPTRPCDVVVAINPLLRSLSPSYAFAFAFSVFIALVVRGRPSRPWSPVASVSFVVARHVLCVRDCPSRSPSVASVALLCMFVSRAMAYGRALINQPLQQMTHPPIPLGARAHEVFRAVLTGSARKRQLPFSDFQKAMLEARFGVEEARRRRIRFIPPGNIAGGSLTLTKPASDILLPNGQAFIGRLLVQRYKMNISWFKRL